MLRLKSDLLPALIAARDGVLEAGRSALARRGGALRRAWRPTAIPASRSAGSEIRGLDAAGDRSAGQDLPRRHAPRRRAADRRWRPRARRHRARQRPRRGARPRLCAPSTASTGRAASAAATSAGGRLGISPALLRWCQRECSGVALWRQSSGAASRAERPCASSASATSFSASASCSWATSSGLSITKRVASVATS